MSHVSHVVIHYRRPRADDETAKWQLVPLSGAVDNDKKIAAQKDPDGSGFYSFMVDIAPDQSSMQFVLKNIDGQTDPWGGAQQTLDLGKNGAEVWYLSGDVDANGMICFMRPEDVAEVYDRRDLSTVMRAQQRVFEGEAQNIGRAMTAVSRMAAFLSELSLPPLTGSDDFAKEIADSANILYNALNRAHRRVAQVKEACPPGWAVGSGSGRALQALSSLEDATRVAADHFRQVAQAPPGTSFANWQSSVRDEVRGVVQILKEAHGLVCQVVGHPTADWERSLLEALQVEVSDALGAALAEVEGLQTSAVSVVVVLEDGDYGGVRIKASGKAMIGSWDFVPSNSPPRLGLEWVIPVDKAAATLSLTVAHDVRIGGDGHGGVGRESTVDLKPAEHPNVLFIGSKAQSEWTVFKFRAREIGGKP